MNIQVKLLKLLLIINYQLIHECESNIKKIANIKNISESESDKKSYLKYK
jgi:hypothetical protein